MTRFRIYLTSALALMFILACAAPALPMDDDTFNTAVAQTVMVGLTEKYQSPTATSSPTATFTPSDTPLPLTETPTLPPTITLTPSITPTPTNTVLPFVQKLIVVVNTNCRAGPDKSFPIEGTLLKGEATTVHGVDPTGQYYYVRNPDPGPEYCWLSGKYATVGGSIAMLPVFTPVPTFTPTATATPTPGFTMAFHQLESCGSWWVDLELTNSGQVAFRSALIKIKEIVKGKTYETGSNGFKNRDGCDNIPKVEDTLEPGKSVIVSTASIPYSIADKKVDVTVSLCTEPGGNGLCITKSITFMTK